MQGVAEMLGIMAAVIFMSLLSIAIKFCLFNCKPYNDTKKTTSLEENIEMETVPNDEEGNQSVKILVHKPSS